MKKVLLSLLVAATFGLVGGTTASASAWHHGSYPKAVRGYWHMPVNKYGTTVQYHYTKKGQDSELYAKANGKWRHGWYNSVNIYAGSIRYRVIGHHKYYFKATKKENNKWYKGADRMILTRKSHRKLTMKLHYKGQNKWYKQTYYAGKVK